VIAPPRTAELILASLGAESQFRDAMLGDLAEEFGDRAERDGVCAARRWYYREATRSTPHLLRSWTQHVERKELARIGGVLVTSYMIAVMTFVFMLMAGIAIAVRLGMLLPTAPIWPNPSAFLLAGLTLYGAAFWTFVGYVVAWLDERTPLISALALVVVLACLALVSSGVGHNLGPVSVRFAASIVGALSPMAGAIIRIRFWQPTPNIEPRTVDAKLSSS